jgi:alpha-beta hydrolase superfamily lysophospholipase
MSKITPTSQTVNLNGTGLCVHTWKPDHDEVKGVVVIFHGFLAHGLYPTVRYAAELLSGSDNYGVVAVDFRGHGQSPGLRGYLPGRDVLIEDGVAIAKYAQSQYNKDGDKNKKCFLLGSSMGGTIALNVAQAMKDDGSIAGVALLAPMLQLSVSAPARSLLWALSYVLPTWQVIPSSSSNAEKQYRDATKRKECEDDEFTTHGGKICVGSASTCVELASCIQDQFASITTPFLVLVADEDLIVNNQGSIDLYEKSPAADKTMKRYPALHGLLCEPSPLVETIHADLLEWIRARS